MVAICGDPAGRMLRRVVARSMAALVVMLLSVVTAAPGRAWGSAAVLCGDSGTPSVVALQDPHFYIDSTITPKLLSGYAGYRVNAGASARGHLWLGLDGFTGGVVGLASGQSATVPLPALSGGGSATRYFLLTAARAATTPQTHNVTVYDGPPEFGTVLCSRTFTYADVPDTIKALANKVTS